MDNKFQQILNEFLKNVDAKDEKELNEKLQEFMEHYNNGEIVYENTALDDAYDLLEKAETAKTRSQAIKFAKQAYDVCPDCFDAILFQVQLEENPIKRLQLLETGLTKEKNKLMNEKFFEKDNIGEFYQLFETRPYIRGLYAKADYLLLDGKIKQALDICKEILRLNESDNTGARYLLMAIYAYLEDEKEILKLYKKYPEEDLEMLFPLFALYYKLGNDSKAKEYLDRVNKANPNLLKYFQGTIKVNEKVPVGYYGRGDSSEVIMYFEQYDFLIDTMPTLSYYIIDYFKKNGKK